MSYVQELPAVHPHTAHDLTCAFCTTPIPVLDGWCPVAVAAGGRLVWACRDCAETVAAVRALA